MITRKTAGLISGPLLFILFMLLPPANGMSDTAMPVIAVALLMAIFWITEALPVAVTALLPIALFPFLNIMPANKVTLSYANHLIYLFMGGFLIATAIEKWNLHKRIALHTINLVGVTPKRMIFGFMFVTAFLSSWVSNTATAMMMVTIGIAVLSQVQKEEVPVSFGTALMLGIAYSASIGGVATLIGTPPNAILAGVLEKTYNIQLGFADWMIFALPLSIVMLLITWFYLTHLQYKLGSEPLAGGKAAITDQLDSLGAISLQEKKVLLVFCFVVAGWLFRGLLDFAWLANVKDSTIAISGAIILFLIPAGNKKSEFILDWASAKKIPWDIIILFGGGFALASGFSSSGLSEWLASQLQGLQGINEIALVAIIVLMLIFLTELTSNTATASLFIPVTGAFAHAIEVQPQSLMVAVALATSFAFMLPVATPPNAIIFSSRQVSIPQMARAGLWLNLVGVVVITLFVTLAG